MKAKISVVVNTLNEEEKIIRCLSSIKWANDIVVVDMHSTDNTVEIARRYGARVYHHKQTQYVEPARNFAIKQAKNDWVLVVDADEEIPTTLKDKLIDIIDKKEKVTHVLIPRKNLILGQWLKHSAEWANHQTRFFKKDFAYWSKDIHRQPSIIGKEYRLPPKEEYAIIHHYYDDISGFISKFDTYTTYHAKRITKDSSYLFKTHHLITKPLAEFVQRFFISRGLLDGSRGLIHCTLMSYYYFLTYAKIWMNKFNFQLFETS